MPAWHSSTPCKEFAIYFWTTSLQNTCITPASMRVTGPSAHLVLLACAAGRLRAAPDGSAMADRREAVLVQPEAIRAGAQLRRGRARDRAAVAPVAQRAEEVARAGEMVDGEGQEAARAQGFLGRRSTLSVLCGGRSYRQAWRAEAMQLTTNFLQGCCR